MTEYICKKPCKIADGEYIVGDRIPANKIAPGREKILIGSGIITVAEAAPEKQEAPAAHKPEAAPAAPIKRKAPAAPAKRKATTQAIATLTEPGQIERVSQKTTKPQAPKDKPAKQPKKAVKRQPKKTTKAG